jgi:choline dehydrogenase
MIEADYIIVGGGTAGCVLADRLSEDGRFKVLLIEAGGTDRRFQIQLPIGYGLSFYDPTVNWMFRTDPEAALDGRSGYWPRGKVLGGSGAINAMVHVRGQRGDFDDWAAMGNPGWSADDLWPYFDRAETRVSGADTSADVHPLCQDFVDAGEQCGFGFNPNLGFSDKQGVGLYRIAVSKGLRLSTARAYLRPAMRRANLRVVTHALASRILLEGKRASGVAFLRNGVEEIATAKAEVILAAGSILSPKLLQLSGIGPGAVLQQHGIAVVHERAGVGRNLQDHLCIDHLYRSKKPTLNQDLGPWLGKIRAALRYGLMRRGPLGLSVNQAGGFVRTRADAVRPNMQLYFSPVSYTRVPAGIRPLMRPDPFPGFLLSAQPCRPTSRGFLEIASQNVQDAPRIVPNSLATAHDCTEILEGAQVLRRLAAAPALAAVIESEIAPGTETASDAALMADIRARASSVFHPIGTCRMGRDETSDVVDSTLKLRGVEGLRVIDASIFPSLVSGNTNATTIAIAEKGADLVLGKGTSP